MKLGINFSGGKNSKKLIVIACFAELSFSKKMTMSTVQRHKSLAIKVKHDLGFLSFFSTNKPQKMPFLFINKIES